MWNLDKDSNKWNLDNDSLSKDTFDVLKQELSKLRFYSKCLSGATYVPMTNTDNIYDILGQYTPRNWYVGSPYSISPIPPQHPYIISATTSDDYYKKYLGEYGLTLKNLFTPTRLINDSIDNYIYVDVATTDFIDNLGQSVVGLKIDGVTLKDGHRVLVKDQKTNEVLLNTDNPDDYFAGNYYVVENLGLTIEYEYYNEDNGIYIYKNNQLIRESDLDEYDNCVRYGVSVKLGDINAQKQFHLSRLSSGYFPTVVESNPIEFHESHNWMLRNKVDYNNLFEINYYDVIKNDAHSYVLDNVIYSIPERTISVGEFGVFLNHQEGISNLVTNKYKVNLRSISQTSTDYWVCGDKGTLLKFRKHDFNLTKSVVDCSCSTRTNVTSSLKSISFFNDLRGVCVGNLNTILLTDNGGQDWTRLDISDFDGYNYNKVIYSDLDRFYLAGDTGVFVEFVFTSGEWVAYKRRVAKYIDSDDEYILVEDINDIFKTSTSTWGLTYSYGSQSVSPNMELLLMVTNNGNVVAYDINNSVPGFDFLYLEFPQNYGDINSITKRDGTDDFYFSSDNIYSFNINDFKYITSDSNIITTTYSATSVYSEYVNDMIDYNGDEIIICGNTSLLLSSTYSNLLSELDSSFDSKLKSKMLFLDYDIASKLNFFDDSQNYRMPNSLVFSGSLFNSGYLSFNEIVYGPTAPSFISVTESNWLTYWRDDQKTFEYMMPLDDVNKVQLSVTFSYYNTATTSTSQFLSPVFISNGYDDILPLAPNIGNKKLGRFSSGTVSTPSPTYSLFLYDYLGIYKTDLSNPCEVGDVIRVESNVVDGNFIVNKVVTIGLNKYYYFFTEFNQSIIYQIKNSTGVTLINLNKYKNINELYYRFNLHPISMAYDLIYSTTSNIATIKPKFNSFTSYYNLASNVNVSGSIYTMKYTNGFLDFGYKPTYNILSYLERLNPDVFFAGKEYLAMPVYNGLPVGSLSPTTIWFESGGMTYSGGSFSLPVNKLYFGEDLKLEWESIFINTFVDVVIHDVIDYSTEKLLIIKKYYDDKVGGYALEFHKRLNFPTSSSLPNSIDISSRRSLQQISDDLQELNNIQKGRNKVTSIQTGFKYTNYQNELNFKIPTDSYAKILLSDSNTILELTSILYIDYKNELSMNITKLDVEYDIPIMNTSPSTFVGYLGNLYVSCSQKHGLVTGDGVVLEFTGGTGSSQELNTQYFGYHVITVTDPYNFLCDIPYGVTPTVGNDIGFVKYVKKDSFFDYSPVDLIDVGVDKKGKKSVILTPENVELDGSIYKLINVDYSKYRYRFVDGLNIEIVNSKYPWILEAEIENAIIGMDSNQSLVWYSGNWECGRWFGGTWKSGVWVSGDWYDGIWESKFVTDRLLTVDVDNVTSDDEYSTWVSGRWFNGTWNGGTWFDGRWYDGIWNTGLWYNGTWNDGTWNDGEFLGGIWVLGQWNNGVFNTNNKPAYWLDGKWYGGDFENGMWYNGIFDQKNGLKSRFGTNAYNSRTATWHGGKWVTGEFHSKLNTNDNGLPDVSDSHKFSIWHTGIWSSGDWYGGIAYDIDFRSGTWHGGILEDIQVIGIGTTNNTFTLNGIFKFNIGDNLNIIDNQIGNSYSVYGSNDNIGLYKVLYAVEDSTNKWTTVYVASDLSGPSIIAPYSTGLRAVSSFKGSNWKSGIWTNGIFSDGLYEGGIWYAGVFNGTWS